MEHVTTLQDIRRMHAAPLAPSLPAALAGIGAVLRMDGVRQFVLRLTPADAVLLLQNVHPRQRKVNGDRVKQLLRSMQSGQWHEPPYTFDSIAFDAEGRLCNGAHRLTALSQHDKPLSFFVIVGVKSPDDMPLPEGDSNLPRTKAFVAGIERNEWAVLTYLAGLSFSGKATARTDVQLLHPVFANALAAIPRMTTHPPAAPLRAAFVFLYATSDFITGQQIAEQWRAYCRVDVAEMWPSIARLYKKVHETREFRGKGSVGQDFRFECAIYAIRNPNAMKILRQADAGLSVREWVTKEVQR